MEKAPTVYLVRKGSDMSFLPYERSERKLNLLAVRYRRRGDRAGAADRLDAYLFSDRGIYRPGDEFHVGIIVKSANWKRPLAGIPLEASIMDSRGLEVKRQKIILTASGFEEIKYRTEETSPTGKYTTNLYIDKGQQAGRAARLRFRPRRGVPARPAEDRVKAFPRSGRTAGSRLRISRAWSSS